MFSVENLHHRLLLNSQKVTICHCSRRRHAKGRTCEATFPKKVAVAYYAYCCFLAIVGHDRQPHLTSLNIKHCVRRIPLCEDCLFLLKRDNFPALADRGKKRIGVEIALVLNTRD